MKPALYRFLLTCWLIVWLSMPGAAQTIGGTAQMSKDDRQPILVSEATRLSVLSEMRGMLESIQATLEASGQKNWQAAATAAEKSGLNAFQKMQATVAKELPEAYLTIAGQAHAAFDKVSKTALDDGRPITVSAGLAEAMKICVTCHQTYRFVLR